MPTVNSYFISYCALSQNFQNCVVSAVHSFLISNLLLIPCTAPPWCIILIWPRGFMNSFALIYSPTCNFLISCEGKKVSFPVQFLVAINGFSIALLLVAPFLYRFSPFMLFALCNLIVSPFPKIVEFAST